MTNSQKHVAKHDVGKNHVSLHAGGQMGEILIGQTLSLAEFTQSARSSTVFKGRRCRGQEANTFMVSDTTK